MKLAKDTDFEMAMCARLSGMIREIGEKKDIEEPLTKYARQITRRVSIMRLQSFTAGVIIGILLTTFLSLISVIIFNYYN